jgi:hypothetical protein
MNSLLIGPQNKTDLLLQLPMPETFTLIDTAGETAVAFANRATISKTLYFDPSDTNYPVGLNVFDGIIDHQQFTEQLTDYLFHLFPAGTNTLTRENAQFLLENCIRVLLCNPPQTLLSVLKLLSDTNFREDCLSHCKDPVVMSNWGAIHALEKKMQDGLFFSLTTKLGKLLNDPVLRNIVGQPYNTFGDVIIIANLDRSKICNMRAKFLGGLLIARSTGHVVITDYGFFNMPIPLEQNRFTLGVNFLDDLTLRQSVLGIENKYVFKTNKKDAEELAFYVGVQNPAMLMDLDPDDYRTKTGRYFAEPQPSLKRLKPLKKRTRACHTRPRLQVERDIKEYLEG